MKTNEIFTATYRHISNFKKLFKKRKKKNKTQETLVWTKKVFIKMTSFFNVLNYKFKNIVIETFGNC